LLALLGAHHILHVSRIRVNLPAKYYAYTAEEQKDDEKKKRMLSPLEKVTVVLCKLDRGMSIATV
jgi:hypothetical protein